MSSLVSICFLWKRFPRHIQRLMALQFIFGAFVLLILYYYGFGDSLSPFGKAVTYSSMISYFANTKGDSLRITWNQSINTHELLKKAIASNVMMVDGDVILKGQNTDNQQMVPVMAFLPSTSSDLTFVDWTSLISKSHKGIQIKFGSIESVELCLQILNQQLKQDSRPIVLSANVIHGPNMAERSSLSIIDAKRFLRLTQQMFPKAIVSLGWLSSYDKHVAAASEGYSWEHVVSMLRLVHDYQRNNPSAPAFVLNTPVHAALLGHNSVAKLVWFSDSVTTAFTVFATPTDTYDAWEIATLRSRVTSSTFFFLDIPGVTDNVRDVVRGAVVKPQSSAVSLTTKGPPLASRHFRPTDWDVMTVDSDAGGVMYPGSGAIVFLGRGGSLVSRREFTPKRATSFVGRVQFFATQRLKTSGQPQQPRCVLSWIVRATTIPVARLSHVNGVTVHVVATSGAVAVRRVASGRNVVEGAEELLLNPLSSDNAYEFNVTLVVGGGVCATVGGLQGFDTNDMQRGEAVTVALQNSDKAAAAAITVTSRAQLLVDCHDDNHGAAIDELRVY